MVPLLFRKLFLETFPFYLLTVINRDCLLYISTILFKEALHLNSVTCSHLLRFSEDSFQTTFLIIIFGCFYDRCFFAFSRCSKERSLPSNSMASFNCGPCCCPVTATRIGINRFLPFTPVSF